MDMRRPDLRPQLIDMIRSVPEVAVRLWSGGTAKSVGDKMRVTFEDRVIEVNPEVFFEAERVAKMLSIRWMGRMLRSIQDVLELRHAAEDLFLQNLFEKSGLPSVLFIPSGVTASAYLRAMIPSDLAYEGGKIISHWSSSIDVAKVIRYDVLWIQLIVSPVLIQIARKAKEHGVLIVYDIDDRLDSIPVDNQASMVYNEPEKQKEMLEIIRLADLVTVSTEPLAEHIRSKGAREVRVVRNMLTANVIPRRHPPNPDFTKIFWAGSPTHKKDLAIVAPALRTILKKYDGKVRFSLLGERLPELLADCYKYIDLVDPVDFEFYHDTIANLAADFGIAPLERNLFNDSKCVNPSTYVCGRNGLSSIGRIVEHRIHDGVVPLKTELYQRNDFKPTVAAYYHNPCRTLKITTKKGFSIEGTPEHRIADSAGNWVTLESLKKGHALSLYPFEFSNKPVSVGVNIWKQSLYHKERPARNRKAKSFYDTPVPVSPIPENPDLLPKVEMSEPLAELVGAILGDGCVQKGTVTITCFSEDGDLVERYVHLLMSFGLNPAARKESKARAVNVSVCCRNLTELLRSIGPVDDEYHKKFEVPDAIMRSPKPVVAAFIRGLFESDATVAPSSVVFTTKSLLLARQVQLLLIGFGIVSSIRTSHVGTIKAKTGKEYVCNRDYYHISLQRHMADLYKESIGFLSTRKKSALERLYSKPHSNAYKRVEMMDLVEKIEESYSEVLDVSVPDGESYWANGFLSHNSAIKALEYASAGYPMLLSPVGEYPAIVAEGFPAELVQDADWEQALERMIARTPAERDRMGKACLSWTLDHRCIGLSKASQWTDVVLDLMAKSKQETPALKS